MTQTGISQTTHQTSLESKRFFRPLGLGSLTLVIAALFGSGCYRATGIQRSVTIAEEIPAVGGDRVVGLKSEAGPGDYFLGNDYVQLAVDGTPFGANEEALAGAESGGSIVDAGVVILDMNYKRVSLPTDALERLTPVVNQDPRIPLVFTAYTPINSGETAKIQMNGYVYDPNGLVSPGTHMADGRLQDVEVIQTISLAKSESFFHIETQVINHGSSPVGIKSIGDALVQGAGGFRALVPAFEDQAGDPVIGWGVELPGSDFNAPLTSSVKAPVVGFLGAEPTGDSFDCHGSLGLLPVDADQFLVATDPQHPLTETRPINAHRVVVGSLPVPSGIAAGATLSHNRRMYLLGGRSVEASHPSQGTGLFNLLAAARANLRTQDVGFLSFNTFGSASWAGPTQSEVRFERNVGTDATPKWKTERVEWQEPPENPFTFSFVLNAILPVGTYRVSVRNSAVTDPLVLTELIDVNNEDRPDLPGPIVVTKDKAFMATNPYAPTEKNYICPERSQILSSLSDAPTYSLFHPFSFTSRSTANQSVDLQPMRVSLFTAPETTFAATYIPGTIDMPRSRRMGSYYSSVTKSKQPGGGFMGEYAFQAGNTFFGTGFYSSLVTYLWSGSYQALASRGPLRHLQSADFETYDGAVNQSHTFIMPLEVMPTGWTSMDIPGPSMTTTGGYHPSEILASALAEDVQVVARTEMDRYMSATEAYNSFAADFQYPGLFTAEQLVQVGANPLVVGARSSKLSDHGTVTALFTPIPTAQRRGGARSSVGWTLADFLSQGGGEYNVIHRPRGPQGLFAKQGFDPHVALGQGANAWWNATSEHSLGKKNGDFDALELIRADFPDDITGLPRDLSDAANANAWFGEFLQVRSDWFAILNQQMPTDFTKALGCSSAQYSQDTPVGLVRTYLKATSPSQSQMMPILRALQQGAAVASTGPLLDVKVGTTGPGGLVSGSSTVSLVINLYASDWVPVDEVRIVRNGSVVRIINPSTELTLSTTDPRLRTGTFTVAMPSDGWIVVEAGVPISTSGAYSPTAYPNWARVMKGIYPIAVTNPIFVDTTSNGYTPPGLP